MKSLQIAGVALAVQILLVAILASKVAGTMGPLVKFLTGCACLVCLLSLNNALKSESNAEQKLARIAVGFLIVTAVVGAVIQLWIGNR